MLEDRLQARLDELRANRDRFIQEAQRNLAALDGAIAELSALLEPPAAVEQNGSADAEAA